MLHRLCKAIDIQIYNLTVLLDLEVVAIGGGISCQPLLLRMLNEVYEDEILRQHPYSEEQARSLPRPAIVPCPLCNEASRWERCWVIERVSKQQPPFEADSKGGCCFIYFFSRGTC